MVEANNPMYDELSLILSLVEAIAARRFDGQVTLVRDALGWRVAFGIPLEFDKTVASPRASLREAMRDLVVEPVSISTEPDES